MASQRRRRVRPLKRSDTTSSYKRRAVAAPREIEWRSLLLKTLTVAVIILDVVLILFIVRHCTRPPVEKIPEPPPRAAAEDRVLRIEVLNGCGVQGLAARYTDYLRQKGFDVVKTDDYETYHVENTVVIDRIGNEKNSMKIAGAMGLNDVLSAVNEAYLIDATVILGKDFRNLSSWNEMEQTQ